MKARTIFNLTKIYEQIDYIDTFGNRGAVTRGDLVWRNGIRGGEVIWHPNNKGRFYTSWIPNPEQQNNVIRKGNLYYLEINTLAPSGVIAMISQG